MPSDKELLNATVKAAGKLFQRADVVGKIAAQLDAETRREETQEAARTSGETEPESET